MRTLELFSDGAIYTVLEKVENVGLNQDRVQLSLPLGVTEIDAFIFATKDRLAGPKATDLIPLETSLVNSGSISRSNYVQVTLKDSDQAVAGVFQDFTETGVTLTTKQGQVWLRKPKMITTMSLGSQWSLLTGPNFSGEVLLHGFLNGVSWTPRYKLLLNDDPNLIDLLALDAQVNNSGESFQVNDLILSLNQQQARDEITYNEVRKSSAMLLAPESSYSSPRAVTSVVNTETKLDQAQKYHYQPVGGDGNRITIDINKVTNLPLWSQPNIQLERLYFLTLGQDKIYYGYQFLTSPGMYMPPGYISVYSAFGVNQAGSLLKRLHFSGSDQNRVTLKLEVSAELDLVSQVTTSGNGGNTNLVQTDYDLTVISRKTSAINLVITYPVADYQSLTADPKPVVNSQWHELVWNQVVQPGKNVYKGSFVLKY